MFSDDNRFSNPKVAPSSSWDVKVIKIMPYPGVTGTGPLKKFTVTITKNVMRVCVCGIHMYGGGCVHAALFFAI